MDDDLTEAQLHELRELLEKTLQEVEQDLTTSTSDAKPVDLGLSIGRLSRVDALQQQYMAMARRQRVELQLQQIRAALRRMESSNYGACIKCDEPIGFARLKARPETPSCRECQSGAGG